jgi:flagellar hook assembly protein FlgD
VLSYVVPYDWQENGMRTSGESRPVRIAMYDIRGKKIRTLVNGRQTIGVHRVTWSGDDDGGFSVRSGMYIVRMSGGKQHATMRIFKVQ